VIASLWRVADTEAAEIMKTLYRVHLDGKVEPAEALRRAKMEFRRSRRPRGESPGQGPPSTSAHPYYWSAFVFIGAPPP